MFTDGRPAIGHSASLQAISARGLLIVSALLLTGCGLFGSKKKAEEGNLFESGEIGQGESFSWTVPSDREDGEIKYHCSIHEPDMKGTIMVDSGAETSGSASVSMVNTSFDPQNITVQPGTKITWTNEDAFAHTVVSGPVHVETGGGNGGDGGGGGGIY